MKTEDGGSHLELSTSLQRFFSAQVEAKTAYVPGGSHPVDIYIGFAMGHHEQAEIAQNKNRLLPEMKINWKWLQNNLEKASADVKIADLNVDYGQRLSERLNAIDQDPDTVALYQHMPGFEPAFQTIIQGLETHSKSIQEGLAFRPPTRHSLLGPQEILLRAQKLIALFQGSQGGPYYPYAPFLELCLLYNYLMAYPLPTQFVLGNRQYLWHPRVFREEELARNMALLQASFVFHTNKLVFIPMPEEPTTRDLILLSPVPIYPFPLNPPPVGTPSQEGLSADFIKRKYGRGIHQLPSALVYAQDILLGFNGTPWVLPKSPASPNDWGPWSTWVKDLMGHWSQMLPSDQKDLANIVFTLLFKGTTLFHFFNISPSAVSSKVIECFHDPDLGGPLTTTGRPGWFYSPDSSSTPRSAQLELLGKPVPHTLGLRISSGACDQIALSRFLALYWGLTEQEVKSTLSQISLWKQQPPKLPPVTN